MTMKTSARQVWDDEQIARAVGYTTSRFKGRGVYATRSFDALADALADAKGDRRAMVYAVTPEGWTVHIINGEKIMTTETNNTAETIANDAAPVAAEPIKVRAPRGSKRDAAIRTAVAKAAKAPKAAKPAKEPKAAKAPKEPKVGKRAAAEAEALAAANAGKLPVAPDFSKPTHSAFRKRLEALIVAAKAGDIAALKADPTEPKSSSRVQLCRWRDLTIAALEARAAKAAAKAA